MMVTRKQTMRVRSAGETHRGGRPSNQDALIIEPGLGLYAVLDGMGGAAAGEVAARVASETLVASIRTRSASSSCKSLLELAIDEAAIAVYRAAENQPGCQGMGTTIVACLVAEPSSLVIGHAGDSRAYLLRNGCLALLTHDHTIAQDYVDRGEMTPDVAEQSWFKHVLTRNLGAQHNVLADIFELTYQPGDRILLCSDGLYGCVSAAAIERVLGSSDAPPDVARTLVELALNSGGESMDNISAVVLDP